MISIVVPLFNYQRYIEENIQSIKSQTYSDWEMIIVDDCSSDDPEPTIKPYISDQIQYIRLEENCGYGVAKNVGIRASKGSWIVVLDADDMLTPTSLEVRLRAMKKQRKKWIHARALEFNDNKPYEFKFRERKAHRRLSKILKTKNYTEVWNNIHAQTVMVHRSIYEKVGLYEPRLRSSGDKEMWARILHNIGAPAYTKEFVCYYRQHRGQMHRSKEKKRNLPKYEKILYKLLERRKKDLKGVERL